MEVCDFGRSFLTFVVGKGFNNARIQLECRCEIRGEGGAREEYFLIAACRSEDTYGEGRLFRVPNYEFCGVFSRNDYVIIRTHLRAEDDRPQWGAIKDFFDEVRIDAAMAKAEVLGTNEAIVKATLANRLLVGRTEVEAPSGRIVLEYPIKTINVNDERNWFQVDTGPVGFPDWAVEGGSQVERFRLAHVVYKGFERAEFILQAPTAVVEGGVKVTTVSHYSDVREMPARNAVLVIEG